MLWTKVEKERLKRAYHARMSRAISGLEAMDISGLSQVYCAVATEDRELIRSGGRAIGMVMEGMTMRQVIRLSEHFRQYTSMEWDIDWKKGRRKTGSGQIGITFGYWPWAASIPMAITARPVWRRWLVILARSPFLCSASMTGWAKCVWLLHGQQPNAWRHVPWMNCLRP